MTRTDAPDAVSVQAAFRPLRPPPTSTKSNAVDAVVPDIASLFVDTVTVDMGACHHALQVPPMRYTPGAGHGAAIDPTLSGYIP
jgi:hypothetical protein